MDEPEKILVVDDDLDALGSLGQLLRWEGYDVLAAGSGEEAIDIFKREKESVKLVLLDLVMPRLGGIETYQRLKELDGSVRAILLTGMGFSESQQNELAALGFVGFIRKPYNIENLIMTTNRYARQTAPELYEKGKNKSAQE